MRQSNVDDKVISEPVAPSRPSGMKTVLRYTGIPPSWLEKRPKLPSRNWLIFLSVASSILGAYVYDRRECKRIREAYVLKVKGLAELPMGPFDVPRKVTVYGSKWPGDEEYDQSLKYFRKYVKPLLVAAAVDFEMVTGKRHGDIARRVAEDVRIRRRFDAGIDTDPPAFLQLPTYRPPQTRREQELQGGTVIIGRPTFKEFMCGLQRGWTRGIRKVDEDEGLARILADDTHFDEPEFTNSESSEKHSTQSMPVFHPISNLGSTLSPKMPVFSQKSSSDSTDVPPATIPAQPPILLVHFLNYIGIKQIPLMLWDIFSQRHKVRDGAEAAYRLIMNSTRPLDAPTFSPISLFDDIASPKEESDLGDLGFDKDVESFYKKSLNSIPADINKARANYYKELQAKLSTARELSRGTRQYTKEEYQNPPPTEVELRAERLKKEKRWRNDLDGWDIIRPDANVEWNDMFRDALTVFVDPSEDNLPA